MSFLGQSNFWFVFLSHTKMPELQMKVQQPNAIFIVYGIM